MKKNIKPIVFITIFSLVIVSIVIYLATKRTTTVDGEEIEIERVLNNLYTAEKNYFSTEGFYSDEISQFQLPSTKRPTVIGSFPGCNTATSEAIHIFSGPYDDTFKDQARAAIEKAQIQGKCSNLMEEFTVFVGQDLDGDSELEIRSIDQDEKVDILLAD